MSEASGYERPYLGLRVVDFSQGVAGPYCGMLLAQQGADVVKIEPSEGDWARVLGQVHGDHTAFSIVSNLGKRSLAIDLKSEPSRSIVDRLIEKADVFIEGFRPGVIDRLGYAYERLAELNPRLLYLSVSGFGQTGPLRERPAMDPMLQAFTGLMSENKSQDGVPMRVPVIVFDMATALYAQQALAGALFARVNANKGRKLEVSLMEAAANLQAVRLMSANVDGPLRLTAVPSGTFRTQDGFLQMIVVKDRDFQKLCTVLGRPQWQSDPRFKTNALRRDHMAYLTDEVGAVFATDTTEHWVAAMTNAQLQVEAVQSYTDFARHPQTEAVGAVSWLAQSGSDQQWPVPNVPGVPKLEAGSRYAVAPMLGQHTREVLSELGYDDQTITQLLAKKVVWAPS